MNAALESFRLFMETGGYVLWLILFVSIILWSLIIERFLFIHFSYPRMRRQWLDEWLARQDKTSWHARSIRKALISEARIKLGDKLMVIRTLIGLCPMLGLLGTVVGMIDVFEVMAMMGGSNPRAMAAGVSQATVTTMAGMVIAISSVFFSKRIEDQVNEESRHLVDMLVYD